VKNKIVISSISSDGITELQSISRETFYDSFASMNTPENMNRYLEEGFSFEKLTREFNDPNSAFYFAHLDDEVVGYLKLNFGGAQTELQDPNAVEIERIYVRRAFQSRSVGQALYDHALSVARSRQAQFVWLGVWEKNDRAIRFYERNGFVAFGTHVFMLGDDAQTDILMKRFFIY
jgi:ribosomal protein S18 acetylase RimI-like enzyme